MAAYLVWSLLAVAGCLVSIQAHTAGSDKRFLFFDTAYNTFGQLVSPGSTIKEHCNLCHNCACQLKDCSILSLSCGFSESLMDCRAAKDITGGWSSWGEWGQCVGVCGLVGTKQRSRACTNPAPARCGAPCDGSDMSKSACYFFSVVIDEKTNKSCFAAPGVNSSSAPVQLSTGSPSSQSTSQASAQTTATKSASTASTGAPSTTGQPTGAVSATTTTTPPPLPTTADCNKICTVSALSTNQSVELSSAVACPSGKHQSSSALPVHCCQIANTVTSWKPGANVMANCTSLPIFTAVAVFNRGHYMLGSAGIFTSCLYDGETGFQMIRQDCDLSPSIVHVTDTQTSYSPDEYYVITA